MAQGRPSSKEEAGSQQGAKAGGEGEFEECNVGVGLRAHLLH